MQGGLGHLSWAMPRDSLGGVPSIRSSPMPSEHVGEDKIQWFFENPFQYQAILGFFMQPISHFGRQPYLVSCSLGNFQTSGSDRSLQDGRSFLPRISMYFQLFYLWFGVATYRTPKKNEQYITIFRLPYYFHLFLPLSSWGLSKRTSPASTPSSSCVFMRTCLKSSREPLNHLGSVKTDSTLAPTWEDADFCGSTCDLTIK